MTTDAGIVQLLVILALIGLLTWALVALVPMPGALATVLIVAAVLGSILLVARRLL